LLQPASRQLCPIVMIPQMEEKMSMGPPPSITDGKPWGKPFSHTCNAGMKRSERIMSAR